MLQALADSANLVITTSINNNSWWSNPRVLLRFQVEPNTAPLPPQQPLPIVGEKLHQVFHSVLENLGKVMDGYCLAEPYFSNKVNNVL